MAPARVCASRAPIASPSDAVVCVFMLCISVAFSSCLPPRSAEKHHIYLLSNGRISMCGINTRNIDYLAKAINDVVVNVKA